MSLEEEWADGNWDRVVDSRFDSECAVTNPDISDQKAASFRHEAEHMSAEFLVGSRATLVFVETFV
jgi:hypothetical protein